METPISAYNEVAPRVYRETSGLYYEDFVVGDTFEHRPGRTVSGRVVANLGWDKVRATAPVFAGDTLYATSKVLSKRLSRSRPTQGIVTVQTTGTNQDGVVVMTFERTMLIYTREGSPAEAANY